MAYRGREIPVFDLSGGQASNRPVTALQLNQALEVDNVHAIPGGGVELRQGDTEVNSSAFGGGTAFTGLQYYRQSDDDEFLVGVAGTAIGKMDYSAGEPDGTWDTITGSVTVTTGQDNTWTSFVAGDDVYFVGGAPNVPFKWTGTGNAATFGTGTPSGDFGFFHNNRIFIGVASTSVLTNSTLTDIEDFTGDGSQNTTVDAQDGDDLIGAAPLNTDVVLLFKQNSIHQLLTAQFPFSRFPLFPKRRDGGTGAVGKHAIVVNEGLAYFITPQARMKATNGAEIIDFPADMDDVWDAIPKNRLPFIQGYVEQGKNFRHIKWVVTASGGTTNSLAIIWDLDNKSWWQYSTGHDVNAQTTDTTDNIVYAGHYDGKAYKKNVSATYTDASESSAGVSGFWRWGWQTNRSFQISLHPQRLNVSVLGETVGNLRVQYGFDFAPDRITKDVSLVVPGGVWDTDNWDEGVWAGQTDDIKNVILKGRGNAFQVKFSNATAGEHFQVNGFTVSGKESGQKIFGVK